MAYFNGSKVMNAQIPAENADQVLSGESINPVANKVVCNNFCNAIKGYDKFSFPSSIETLSVSISPVPHIVGIKVNPISKILNTIISPDSENKIPPGEYNTSRFNFNDNLENFTGNVTFSFDYNFDNTEISAIGLEFNIVTDDFRISEFENKHINGSIYRASFTFNIPDYNYLTGIVIDNYGDNAYSNVCLRAGENSEYIDAINENIYSPELPTNEVVDVIKTYKSGTQICEYPPIFNNDGYLEICTPKGANDLSIFVKPEFAYGEYFFDIEVNYIKDINSVLEEIYSRL